MAETVKSTFAITFPKNMRKVNFLTPAASFNKPVRILQKTSLSAILINIGIIILIVILRNMLPPQVPLFYGLAEGEAQLTPTLGLAIPSVTSICIVLINSLLMALVKDEFLKRILVYSSLAVTILSAITTIRIILLVGSF